MFIKPRLDHNLPAVGHEEEKLFQADALAVPSPLVAILLILIDFSHPIGHLGKQ